MFWGGHGGNVDFTNPRGVQWWKDNVRHQLIDMGIESTWNDNNEYELWSEDAICDGFGHPVELDRIRPVQALLTCLLYTSPSPRDRQKSRMPSSA